MDYKTLINERKKDFNAAAEWVKQEIAGIRTGRAHSSMVEDLVVDYVGSKLRVRELATISVPEPRVIFIQPWDKGAIPLIEKAIKDSPLGLNPTSDSSGIRLTIPPLTEDRRKEFTRLLRQKAEEAKIKARQTREDVLKKVQNAVREKTAREDDLRNAKEELQKVIDELNKKIDDLVKRKETELAS
ncbi:MAG: ribosome recycling factor [Candidatus Yanofskybacteria bacterium RIFCSPHIGHO2_02_FULL_43_22]|uniref:Ribosome-recycling factor n=1 Tax=Candidatus Yanofskybacteria bacterium RIFCSPHIGHO2_02_FULL_43_22 TaxID=1802681 RepID=A0A1F8FKX9_9BACT|nr:MAG: ribosome recycling factor [Candidatus Yanofskybacteria bacterium RIFCSPHIGHO2_02_FULL_43_22]